MASVRVVVVDDSATMRGLISATLRMDPDIEVVGTACDPYEAREAIKQYNPDVVTLDIEMPRMDGISFLEKIMRLRPMPVIIVSTLTEKGTEASVKALSLGAFDCVCKPKGGDLADAFENLAETVKAAAQSNMAASSTRRAAPDRRQNFRPNGSVIAMGSSTGGVEAVISVVKNFPENCPPTVITQHMPETFTKSFASRLDRLCAPKVEEAWDGAPLENGRVYIAPGGVAHLAVTGGVNRRCILQVADKVSGHRPSVDVLFKSVAEHFGKRCAGVILSGMGKDGAKGLLEIRNAGGKTFGQNEETCVVYGMPKVARQLGAVEKELPLSKIADAVISQCEAKTSKGEAA